jgi:hypothetical protein
VFSDILLAYVSSVLVVSDVCFKHFTWMLHSLIWLYTHVSSVCFKCLRCFQTYVASVSSDITKVDLDVAYVVMAIHTCFKCFICF